MAANREKTEKKSRGNGKPFAKGKSGNPSGRPKVPQEFKDLAKEKSLDALNKIIEIMENPESDKKDVLRASEMIIDRAWGKATQQIEADVKGEIAITIEGEVKEWAK